MCEGEEEAAGGTWFLTFHRVLLVRALLTSCSRLRLRSGPSSSTCASAGGALQLKQLKVLWSTGGGCRVNASR